MSRNEYEESEAIVSELECYNCCMPVGRCDICLNEFAEGDIVYCKDEKEHICHKCWSKQD